MGRAGSVTTQTSEPRDSAMRAFPAPRAAAGGAAHAFIDTPWNELLRARARDPRQAVALVCQHYWFPVYGFIRTLGVAQDEALDVTQGFFAGVLERDDLARVDPARGRFRSWLRSAARAHLYNELDRARAKKRGQAVTLSIDALSAAQRLALEPHDDGLSPDRLFDRRWALTVTERTLERLRARYAEQGKAELFAGLAPGLGAGEGELSDGELCTLLGKSQGALRQERHRMRQQYKSFLRQEVTLTVASADAVDDEIRQLIDALG
jgi:RNA polymerase sigma factor (sigma-70 family)